MEREGRKVEFNSLKILIGLEALVAATGFWQLATGELLLKKRVLYFQG